MGNEALTAFFTPDRIARLPPEIRLNSGEVCRNLPLYVAAQLARAQGNGKAARVAEWNLNELKNLIGG